MRIWWLILALLSVAPPALGIDQERRLDQLSCTPWTARVGAPSQVRALAPAILRLGTLEGLYRFDGVHYERYRPESGGPFTREAVAALLTLPDGGPWIGYYLGGAGLLKDGHVTNHDEREGLPSSPSTSFAVDQEGFVWALTTDRFLMRLGGHRWEMIGLNWGFPDSQRRASVDRQTTLGVTMADRIYFLPKGETWFGPRGKELLPLMIGVAINTLIPDSQAVLWVIGGPGLYRMPNPGKLARQRNENSADAAPHRTHPEGPTWWFRLFPVIPGVGTVWMFPSYGVNQATARVRQQLGAQLEERERIARELHDTLLKRFQGLMPRFQEAMKTLPDHPPARQMMDRGGEVPRIGREAISNAFLHFQASNIEAVISDHRVGVRLTVRDDGSGIGPGIPHRGREGHWSLARVLGRAPWVQLLSRRRLPFPIIAGNCFGRGSNELLMD